MTIVYQTVTAGDVYSRTITASNTIYFAAENLPQGLSINQEGVISGVLQQAGRFAITILARGVGGTGAAILDLTVNTPPTPFITSADAVTHEMNTAFSYQITASSPTAILSYGATNLPTGLSVDTGTGLITGTPTSVSNDAAVTITTTVSATNAAGTGSQNLIFTLQQRPVITSSLSPLLFPIQSPMTPYQITATKSPTLFGASPLPNGITIDSATGVISGTANSSNTVPTVTTVANFGVYGGANWIRFGSNYSSLDPYNRPYIGPHVGAVGTIDFSGNSIIFPGGSDGIIFSLDVTTKNLGLAAGSLALWYRTFESAPPDYYPGLYRKASLPENRDGAFFVQTNPLVNPPFTTAAGLYSFAVCGDMVVDYYYGTGSIYRGLRRISNNTVTTVYNASLSYILTRDKINDYYYFMTTTKLIRGSGNPFVTQEIVTVNSGSPQDGPLATARLGAIGGMAVSSDGSLFVADTSSNKIKKIDFSTNMVSTVAGSGAAGYLDGLNTSAVFNGPEGIVFDSQGNLFICDINNYAIRIRYPSGEISTVIKSETASGTDGPFVSAGIARPSGITIGPDDTVYFADDPTGNGPMRAFRKFNLSEGTLTTIISASNNNGALSTSNSILMKPIVYPVISSGDTTGSDGESFSYQITLGGGTSNLASSYGATNLPSGVSINTSTGLISGTLNSGWPETGIMSIGLSAVSVLGPTITKTITLTINPGLFDGGGQVSPSATYGTLFADYYTGQNRVRYVSNLLGGTRYLRTLGSSFGPSPGTIRLRGVIETFNNKIYASYTNNNTTFNIAKWNGSSWAPYYQQALQGQNGESPLLFDTNNSIYFMDNSAIKKITDAGVASTFLTGLTNPSSFSIYNHNGSSQYMLVARLASFANPTNIIFEFYNMSGTLLHTVTKSGVNTGPGGNYGVVTGLAPFAPFVASPLSYGFTAYASGNNYRLSTFTQAGETLVDPNVAPYLPVTTFQWGFGVGANASGQPSSNGALYYYTSYTAGNRTLTYLRTDVPITSLSAYNYATTSVTPGSRNGPLP